MGVAIDIACMRTWLRRHCVLVAPIRMRRTTVVLFSIGERSSELTLSHRTLWSVFQSVPSPCSGSCLYPVGVRVSSPQACLLTATILEEGTTIERAGPSDFGSDELVWKYLSKDMSIDCREDGTLSTHVPKFLLHVACHTPKIHGENFRGTTQICKIRESFLPRKFPAIRYFCGLVQNFKSLYS